MPDLEPVYKLTILPRGRTGGHALVVPEDDKELMTRSEMIARLVFALGGRAAEELVFHEPTTGASADIEQATKIAKAMVTEYGMSGRLGAVKYGQDQGDPFLGRSMGHQPDYSLEVAHEIDEEVRALIEAAHTEAWGVLNQYRDVLDDLVLELLDHETLQRKDLARIFARVEKRPRITEFNDFGGRTPSEKPPVKTRRELAGERGEPWPPVEDTPPTPVGTVPSPVPGQLNLDNGSTGGSTNNATNGAHTGNGQSPPGHSAAGSQPYGNSDRTPGGSSNDDSPTSGPPYYGAPPGWTPATTAPGQSWTPQWGQSGPQDAVPGDDGHTVDTDDRDSGR
jgi:cell division protease FtsH